MPNDEACLSSRSPSSTPPLPPLLDWLVQNGVWISHKIRIGRVSSDDADEANMGVFATNSIEEEEILCIIPKRILLSRKNSSLGRIPAFMELCDLLWSTHIHPQPDTIILSMVLLWEMLQGSTSSWSAYISSLPDVQLPSFWHGTTATQWLAGTDVLRWQQVVGSTKVALTDLYHSLLSPWLASIVTPSMASPSAILFIRAYSLVSSRAFYVDNFHGLCMVPLADIFNHHYQPSTCLQADDVVCGTCGLHRFCEHDKSEGDGFARRSSADEKEEEAVEMVATSSIMPEMEVYNTYGALSNSRLLAEYGFTLEANDDDRVCWFSLAQLVSDTDCAQELVDEVWAVVSGSEDQAAMDDRVALVTGQPNQLQDALWIDAEGRVSSKLWRVLQLVSQKLNNSRSSIDLDRACSSAIIGLCERRLSSLQESYPDFEQLCLHLDASSLSAQERLAIQRNIEERSLLSSCLYQWQEALQEE